MWDYDAFAGELAPEAFRRVRKEAERVAGKIFREGMTELEKAYAANVWLASHVTYDYFWYDQGYTAREDPIPRCDRTLEGPFLNRVAVCAGFAKAYCWLLHLGGVSGWYVTGQIHGGGRHAWNVVRLEGQMYHVDVTWNIGKAGQSLFDAYFLLDDAQMSGSRSWEKGECPPCPGGRYSAGCWRDEIRRKKKFRPIGAAGFPRREAAV